MNRLCHDRPLTPVPPLPQAGEGYGTSLRDIHVHAVNKALASMLAFAQETQVLTAHPKRTTRKQLT